MPYDTFFNLFIIFFRRFCLLDRLKRPFFMTKSSGKITKLLFEIAALLSNAFPNQVNIPSTYALQSTSQPLKKLQLFFWVTFSPNFTSWIYAVSKSRLACRQLTALNHWQGPITKQRQMQEPDSQRSRNSFDIKSWTQTETPVYLFSESLLTFPQCQSHFFRMSFSFTQFLETLIG